MDIMIRRILLLLLLFKGSCGSPCTVQTASGCTVTDGLATCPLTSQKLELNDLPACTTGLHVPMPRNVTGGMWIDINVKSIAGKPMPHLTEVLILAADKKTFASSQLHLEMTAKFFKAVPNLEIFSLKAFSDVSFKDDAFKPLMNLRSLEFTRVRRLDLTSFMTSIQSLQQNPIHTLALKGIQNLSQDPTKPYVAVLDLEKLICPLRMTLQYLDLSHNDFLAISSAGCLTHLKTLDLGYNLLTNIYGPGFDIANGPALAMLLMAEKLYIDYQWATKAEADSHLWNDTKHKQESTSQLLPDSAVNFIPIAKDFSSWFRELLPYCPMSKNYMGCIGWDSMNNFVEIFECVFPNVSDPHNPLPDLCNLHKCAFNIILPLVALREIHVSHIKQGLFESEPGTFFHLFGDLDYSEHAKKTVCFSPSNHLEILDWSYFDVFKNTPMEEGRKSWNKVSVTGLHLLRIVKFQAMGLPAFTSPSMFSDMPALEELHISENLLTPADHLPLSADFFKNKPNLRFVNVSHAKLAGIEQHAFHDNPNLRILDVSYNLLTSFSFLIDLAHSKISYLDLRGNHIHHIGADMRQELDKLGPVELDLSENPLICDCSSLDFIHWAQKAQSHIRFINNHSYICDDDLGGNFLFSVDVELLETECEVWRQNLKIVSASMMSTLTVVLLCIAWSKRWQIRHRLFIWQEQISAWRHPASTSHEEYTYDAFLIYNGETDDRLWVHKTLTTTLEQTYGFQLCIYMRDFVVGAPRLDAVEQAIRQSRKVIAVITPNFVEDGWCLDELQMTRSVESEQQCRKLIVVVQRDFDHVAANIPPVVSLVLNNCLHWKSGGKLERSFWKKLVKALYT